MAVDDRYEQQLKIFEQLRERINKLLNRFGEPDSLVHLGDYSVHGDYWGYPQVKVSLGKLELLRPEIIDLLQKSLTGFSGWEIVVAVAVRGHYDDWPEMGLFIRAREIIDGLQRQYFPEEFQNIKYPRSRPGSVA